MLNQFFILRNIISFIIPYIFLYALYVQMNGEISPGGGFQAGVIFATSIIGYNLIDKANRVFTVLKQEALIVCGVIGVLIYATTGAISLIFDEDYLNYGVLSHNKLAGRHLGIFMIELGVGLTVAAIMCLIYSLLRKK